MIRTIIFLIGLLSLQAGYFAYTSDAGAGDFYANFGDGLRHAVDVDTGALRHLVQLSNGGN